MSSFGRSIIVFTGAPSSSSLQWEEEFLSAPLQACFTDNHTEEVCIPSLSDSEPVWRSLWLEPEQFPTGFTQLVTDFSHVAVGSEPCNDQTSALQRDEDDMSQYYEYSFAAHEKDSSQDSGSSQTTDSMPDSDRSFSTTFNESSTSFDTCNTVSSKDRFVRTRLASSRLVDLNHLPNATYLRSITPQTMTVNIVVGIISIPQPRLIKTTRNARTVELVEMIVGDDSKAGFGINIWLPSPQFRMKSAPQTRIHESAVQAQNLQSAVMQLRPRDIIFVRNVALHSYKGKVYGQSLRKDITTINLLYRNLIDLSDQQGTYSAKDLKFDESSDPQISKVRKVRRWVDDFVGLGMNRPHAHRNQKEKHRQKRLLQVLPPDTPS